MIPRRRAQPLILGALLSLRASAEGPRRFSIGAYDGGPLPVNGFKYPVIVDLTGIEIPVDQTIPLLIDHEISYEATLGQTDSIENSGQDLQLAGPVTGISQTAMAVLKMHDGDLQAGIPPHKFQASIGMLVTAQEEVPAGRTVTVNGRTFPGPVIVARRSMLRETSVLPMGADATTSVNLAAAAAQLKGSAMSFEEWLASLGIDTAAIDETNRTALMLAYEAQQSPAPAAARGGKMANAEGATFEGWLASQGVDQAALTPEELATYQQMYQDMQAATPSTPSTPAAAAASLNLVASLRRQAADELRRHAQIQAKTVGFPLIAAAAISGGWTVDKTELEVLKARAKGRAPAGHVKSDDSSPQVLEAALCMARKIPGHEKQYSDQVLQAAHSQFRGRIGLQQVLLASAAQNGYHVRAGDRVSMGNLGEVLRAAFSSVSLPGVLSNIANKELLTGYQEIKTKWREIAKIKSVSDFKQVTSYRMLDNMEYEELGPGGKIQGGSIDEESYTRQIDTFAKMFSLTRKDIINDDMGAFDDLRERIGQGAAKKLNKLFWTKFLANSSFFTSARTNYIEGSTTNLGTDGVGLGLGQKAFLNMTTGGSDGEKNIGDSVGHEPEILLVPPALMQIAEALYKNQNLMAVKTSDANIYAGKYRPVPVPELGNSSYTGSSDTAWYLMTNPAYMPTMVVSFLDGVETPTVESADADFDTLGVQFRGYHDFGCDLAEYLGGLKSKGAA